MSKSKNSKHYVDVLSSKLDNWKTEGQGWGQLGAQLGFDGSDDIPPFAEPTDYQFYLWYKHYSINDPWEIYAGYTVEGDARRTGEFLLHSSPDALAHAVKVVIVPKGEENRVLFDNYHGI